MWKWLCFSDYLVAESHRINCKTCACGSETMLGVNTGIFRWIKWDELESFSSIWSLVLQAEISKQYKAFMYGVIQQIQLTVNALIIFLPSRYWLESTDPSVVCLFMQYKTTFVFIKCINQIHFEQAWEFNWVDITPLSLPTTMAVCINLRSSEVSLSFCNSIWIHSQDYITNDTFRQSITFTFHVRQHTSALLTFSPSADKTWQKEFPFLLTNTSVTLIPMRFLSECTSIVNAPSEVQQCPQGSVMYLKWVIKVHCSDFHFQASSHHFTEKYSLVWSRQNFLKMKHILNKEYQ